MPSKRFANMLHELEHHLPFTVFAALLALVILGVYTELLVPAIDPEVLHAAGHEHGSLPRFANLFHVFHPIHVFVSAAATSAMFWRYDRRLAMAVVTGLFGALVVCGVSDVALPFLGGRLLHKDMHWHLCVCEHPVTVVSFAGMGIAAGIAAAARVNSPSVSKVSHAMHVSISTGATILYLLGYGLADWTSSLVPVFILVVLAVVVPCCVSDIVFPLFLVNKSGIHWCMGSCKDHD